eukprot:gi/632988401/ref/XP_007883091.1/ PREDICTED: scavenger receptor cysteine-rich type 1 protein M130-like isoform X2 [Callorhinchus milii]
MCVSDKRCQWIMELSDDGKIAHVMSSVWFISKSADLPPRPTSTDTALQSSEPKHLLLVLQMKQLLAFLLESVRLVNGGRPCSGRVEVYHRGKWGTVGDYRYGPTWDMEAAAVVCKELGCGAALSASRDAHFGEGSGGTHFGRGSGPIVTYGVRCRGNESALRDCHSRTWAHYYGSLSYEVSVICSGK